MYKVVLLDDSAVVNEWFVDGSLDTATCQAVESIGQSFGLSAVILRFGEIVKELRNEWSAQQTIYDDSNELVKCYIS